MAVVGVLALLTWRQNGSYSDEIALYRATLDKNPDSWIAHYTLGFALVQTGQGDEIIKQFENALSLHPDFPEAHNGLGAILTRTGRAGEAVEHFRQALQSRPYYVEARINLGARWCKRAASMRPLTSTRMCSACSPMTPGLLCNMAKHYSRQTGLTKPSMVQAGDTTKPDNPRPRNILGITLAKVGRL